MLEAFRIWSRRHSNMLAVASASGRRRAPERAPGPDSPLSRARLAAESGRVARALDASRRAHADPDVIARLSGELARLRGQLSGGARAAQALAGRSGNHRPRELTR